MSCTIHNVHTMHMVLGNLMDHMRQSLVPIHRDQRTTSQMRNVLLGFRCAVDECRYGLREQDGRLLKRFDSFQITCRKIINELKEGIVSEPLTALVGIATYSAVICNSQRRDFLVVHLLEGVNSKLALLHTENRLEEAKRTNRLSSIVAKHIERVLSFFRH